MSEDKEYLDRLGVENEPRAYTEEEVREMYLSHMHNLAEYWSNVDGRPCIEKIEGAMFSVLTMLDGATMLPAVDLALSPHETDKDYNIEQGENWFEPGMVFNYCEMHHEFNNPRRDK